MTTVLLRVASGMTWVRDRIWTKSFGLFLLSFAIAAVIAIAAGIYVGSKGPFGVAASGLILTVMAQIADMVEQTPYGTANTSRTKRIKDFSNTIKLLGIVLLGIGGMVGLGQTS